jgi:hypothetical protein
MDPGLFEPVMVALTGLAAVLVGVVVLVQFAERVGSDD